jgi:sec-independent protein translocase protein TatC
MSEEQDLGEDLQKWLTYLEGLRKGLIRTGLLVLLLSVAGFFFSRSILTFLQRKTGVTLAYYALSESLLVLLNIALFSALFAAMPFLLYQLLAALRGVFPSFSKKRLFGFWLASVLFFYLGAGFCLTVTLPYGIRFLLGYQGAHIEALISVRKFTAFVLGFVFSFGLVFELPLVMILLGRLGLLQARRLSRYRSHAVLAVAVLSAVLTPTPDAFNMMLMAVPLYLLFEVGLLGMRLFEKKDPRD